MVRVHSKGGSPAGTTAAGLMKQNIRSRRPSQLLLEVCPAPDPTCGGLVLYRWRWRTQRAGREDGEEGRGGEVKQAEVAVWLAALMCASHPSRRRPRAPPSFGAVIHESRPSPSPRTLLWALGSPRSRFILCFASDCLIPRTSTPQALCRTRSLELSSEPLLPS